MTYRKNYLTPYKFYLNNNYFSSKQIKAIYMPNSWSDLFKSNKRGSDFQYALKLDDIGKHIQNMFPDVIGYNLNNNAIEGNEPWLYVYHNHDDLNKLQVFFINWIVNKKQNNPKLNISNELIRNAMKENITSTNVDINTLTNDNRLIEGILSKEYCSKIRNINYETINRKKETDIIKKNLSFYHCITNQEHICISETIQPIGTNAMFSYVVSFKIVIEPVTLKKCVNFNINIRRWMFKKDLKIGFHTGHSLYVHKKENNYFSHFRIDYDNQSKQPKITYPGSECFTKITNIENVQTILKDPSYYLSTNDENLFIGIPYGENSFGGSYPIKSGIGLVEKHAIWKDFKSYANDIEISEVFQNIELLDKYNLPKLKDSTTSVLAYQNLFYQSDKLINIKRLEIWTSKDTLFPKVIQILKGIGAKKDTKHFGFDDISNNTYQFTFNNSYTLILELKEIKTGKITSQMIDNTQKSESERELEINEFINNIQKNNQAEEIISLIEIEDFKGKKGDPKNIIRKTLLKNNRKTQFIFPYETSEENFEHRVFNSLIDILSKLGISINYSSLTNGQELYGFDIIKTNSNLLLPVASRVNNEGTYISFDSKKWLSYETGILELNKILKSFKKYKKDKSSTENKIHVENMVRSFVEEIKKNNTHKIIFITSHLRSRLLDTLQNEKFNDNFPFLKAHNTTIVRCNNFSDVPDYELSTIVDKYNPTKSNSLFRVNEHTFYSIGKKQDTDKVNKIKSNEFHYDDVFRKPNALEFVIFSNQNSLDIENIAIISHNSRNIPITTDYHLIYPYPLYIINSLKEYLELF